jgi:hypothetical protein
VCCVDLNKQVADFNLSKIIEDSGTASGGIASGTKTGTMAGANPKWLVRAPV